MCLTGLSRRYGQVQQGSHPAAAQRLVPGQGLRRNRSGHRQAAPPQADLPGSPKTKPGGTTGNTPAQSSSSGSAPPSSPATTLAPSSTRSTAAPMDRARSISSVLHGRLQQLQLPEAGIRSRRRSRRPRTRPPAPGRHRRRSAMAAHPPPRSQAGSRPRTPSRELHTRTSGNSRP